MSVAAETRTLLFSDIEGSTRLAIAAGDRYADILAAHRALIRSATGTHNGVEQSTEGDGFFLLFRSARDALAAAVDAQLALAAHPWTEGLEVRVRMGLHAGEIGWSDDDVVGLAIHEAARIMGAAHGGQVLTSSVVRDLTAGACPPGVSMRSLGPHKLKDFDDPVELLQVCHADLLGNFPPPKTTRTAVVDLPTNRTSFIGREREAGEVMSLVANARHVTLTGIGGSGKTRLALEVAQRDADRHPDGVFFVDLAPLADPDLVLGAVAAGANVQGDPSDLETMVVTYLSGRRAMIVLDNCEHVIDACAYVVDVLLARCPGVHVLATSREALQIDGEQTFNVPSLGVEDEGSAAVRLFVSRASAVKSGFAIADSNCEAILAVCRRLDGIPLAIELAAGRVDHMSVTDIADRLDDRFELLVGGRRRRAQRQQTLQAAMDWSWDLLNDGERALLRRMAVFAGPFSLESAEAVCATRSTLAVLSSLVAKSLVTMQDGAGSTRYRLLETVRLYAQERLVEAAEAAGLRDAHRDWYLAVTEGTGFDAFFDFVTIASFVSDHANLRAAMDWSAGQGRVDLVARQMLLASLAWSHSAGLFEETERSLLHIAETDELPLRVRADVFGALALLKVHDGDLGAIHGLAARSLALDDSDRPFLPGVLLVLGRYPEATAAAVRLGQPAFARTCRSWESSFTIMFDPMGSLEKLLDIAAEVDPHAANWDGWFANMGIVLARLALDDADGALEAIETNRPHFRVLEEQRLGSFGRSLDVLQALTLAHLGRTDEARAALLPITRAVLRDHYPIVSNECLLALAYIVDREGDPVRAAELLQPMLRDGRVRSAPMYAFVFWLLTRLHAELAGVELQRALPAPLDEVLRAQSIATGGWTTDPTAVQDIEDELATFVAVSS